jgi:uncharacterized membrane protein YfcA
VGLDFSQFGWFAMAIGAVSFVLGGMVKGVIGLGLPMVAVPVLATFMDPKVAVALMSVPVLTSNIWIVGTSGRLRELVRRYWSVLVALTVFTFAGAQFFVKMDVGLASIMVGTGIVVVCLFQAFPIKATLDPKHEVWLGPVAGTAAGIMGGMTNYLAPIMIAYLMALKVPRDLFVFSMSLFFVFGSAPLFGSLALHHILDANVLVISAVATLLVIAGLQLGAALRRLIPQAIFEKILLAVLFLIGLNLIRRGIF